MDTTELMLKALDPGALQRLACDLLTLLHTNWGVIHKSGGVEGTNKTRKGTPDAWCECEDGTLVYIQATGDSSKGKILNDLEKSIIQLKKLERNIGALCVSFLNFDPQNDEIEKCKAKAKENKCDFMFYSNSGISKLLQKKYPELLKKYLPLQSSEFIKNVKSVIKELEIEGGEILVFCESNYEHRYSNSNWNADFQIEYAKALNYLNSKLHKVQVFYTHNLEEIEKHGLEKNFIKIVQLKNPNVIDRFSLNEGYEQLCKKNKQSREFLILQQCRLILEKIKRKNKLGNK
ncbi:hypothetical protein H1230_16825 [Paenibacillus sp. 19GGS1-52]|uniref:hypothetical protein n=1 Tax=Paenibacillus sp. 19GGS1-52 TaxID=2758563 RepID=UPI001EFBB7F4|nr:hypothetical protein [Paenibacillus sp. 19GGS1-52]ULO04811.1 hypothetical protein H1230_16825 [Paenibacillus sp. 19GGS1-52]